MPTKDNPSGRSCKFLIVHFALGVNPWELDGNSN
jgi:hypothetical protein